MCLSPKYIVNPALKKMQEDREIDVKKLSKYKPFTFKLLSRRDGKVKYQTRENFHYVTDNLGLQEYIKVDCGKCVECLKKKINQTLSRISVELDNHDGYGFFVTLTYNDEHLPICEALDKDTGELFYVQTVLKDDVQKFVKRLRMNLSRKRYDIENLKYHYISEYGMSNTDNQRPHYHILLFVKDIAVNQLHDACAECWKLGFVTLSTLKSTRMRYMATAHVTASKLFPNPKGSAKPFSHWSKGFGVPQKDSTRKYMRDNQKVNVEDFNYSLSRYQKEKIFDETELKGFKDVYNNLNDVKDDEMVRFEKYAKKLFPSRKIEDLTFSEVKKVDSAIFNDSNFEYKKFYKRYVLKKK